MRWDFPEEGGRPYDDLVGPFPHRAFVDAWSQTMGRGEALSIEAGRSFLPLVVDSGTVGIAGDADVTDYHSPLGGNPAALAPELGRIADEYTRVSLDSLPEDSARLLADGLAAEGREAQVQQHEAAAVIVVEEEYLAGLSKKQRHEVRRKRRRFVEELGEPELVVTTGDGPALDRFAAMHRRSMGEKGEFLTGSRHELFQALHGSEGWELAELTAGGKVVASLFGYREPDAYYLYNSAYDPESREASPGVVALHLLIESLVESGCRRIDLLKGDEIYKFRMGAVPRPLFEVSF